MNVPSACTPNFGDYNGATASPSRFHFLWADGRLGNPDVFAGGYLISPISAQPAHLEACRETPVTPTITVLRGTAPCPRDVTLRPLSLLGAGVTGDTCPAFRTLTGHSAHSPCDLPHHFLPQFPLELHRHKCVRPDGLHLLQFPHALLWRAERIDRQRWVRKRSDRLGHHSEHTASRDHDHAPPFGSQSGPAPHLLPTRTFRRFRGRSAEPHSRPL